jgi:hypothetical protein
VSNNYNCYFAFGNKPRIILLKSSISPVILKMNMTTMSYSIPGCPLICREEYTGKNMQERGFVEWGKSKSEFWVTDCICLGGS